jgi:hypothetical protein
MLDCYVYVVFSIVMYVLHFLYVGFWRLPSQGGRQNMQKKIKKILCSSIMFINSPMYIIYIPQLAEKHKFKYVLGWPRNIRSDMFLSFGSRNVSLDMFLGFERGT